MMAQNGYYRKFLDALQGNAVELRDMPRARHDWGGVGIVLDIFKSAADTERPKMIRAFCRIIDEANEYPVAAARVIYLATALQLDEVRPAIEKVSGTDIVKQESYLEREVNNYFALTLHSQYG